MFLNKIIIIVSKIDKLGQLLYDLSQRIKTRKLRIILIILFIVVLVNYILWMKRRKRTNRDNIKFLILKEKSLINK